MKKSKVRQFGGILLVAAASVVSALPAQAQRGDRERAASINPQMLITLSDVGALSDKYVVSIADLGFSSEEAAKKQFGWLQDNLVGFKVNYAEKTVEVSLRKAGPAATWSVAQWNEYLQRKSARFTAMKK